MSSSQNGGLVQNLSHNKHISMNGLPYEKMKGLTPVSNNKISNKKPGGFLTEDEQSQVKGPINSRNNHTRMPSLPHAAI